MTATVRRNNKSPADLHGLTDDQLTQLTQEIQAKIRKLDAERKKYVAEQQKKNPRAASTLDKAVVTAVRDSGAKKGYRFEQ